MISVTHLSKKYGAFTAADDLCFDVREGEVLGLLGPNGAGKTTTMRMVTGFLPPSKGRVRIAGYDLYDSPVQAKRNVGYLPEQPPLWVASLHPANQVLEGEGLGWRMEILPVHHFQLPAGPLK